MITMLTCIVHIGIGECKNPFKFLENNPSHPGLALLLWDPPKIAWWSKKRCMTITKKVPNDPKKEVWQLSRWSVLFCTAMRQACFFVISKQSQKTCLVIVRQEIVRCLFPHWQAFFGILHLLNAILWVGFSRYRILTY
jgi:hypothetical protein